MTETMPVKLYDRNSNTWAPPNRSPTRTFHIKASSSAFPRMRRACSVYMPARSSEGMKYLIPRRSPTTTTPWWVGPSAAADDFHGYYCPVTRGDSGVCTFHCGFADGSSSFSGSQLLGNNQYPIGPHRNGLRTADLYVVGDRRLNVDITLPGC